MALSFGRIGGELLKPGGAMRIPSMVASEFGGYIGRKIRGDEQPSYTTNIQPVQTKKVQTYNSRYPGFDEEDYNRLLQIVDSTGKTGSEKAQLMDEAYQYYYPQVLNKHKLDERQETINNWVYENGEKLANGDKLTNAQYRLLNLTQMAKEKFDIAYNVEDTQIIHNIVEKTPNGQELLTKFLDTGDPELLYATGIYDKGQEAQDFRSQKDIANEVLGGNFWKNAWNAMYANSFAPLDSAEKFLYRGIKNMQMLGTKIDDYFADKDIPEGLRKDAFGNKTAEQIRTENQEFRDTSKREIDDYINLVNNANQSNRARTVNPIVDNYYQRRNFTDLLAEGDIDGFFYKGLGDAASNRDMPIIIGASIVNPAMGTALMGTNSYVRESEEAYETMRKAGATHEQAEVGAGVVGLINSAIEVYLDKLLGGTETTTTKGVRDAIKNNVMKEVTNKPFEEIVSSATKTYVGSSLEEGLEEWLQNIVTNAAEMTVKENPEWKDLFEGGRAAAEGGIFNPFNILAPGGDIARNVTNNNLGTNANQNVNQGIANTTQTNNQGDKATFKEELYSIDPTLKKNLQNNPYTAEVWQRTQDYIDKNGRPERSNDVAKNLIVDVADKVQEKLVEKMEEGGKNGKLYQTIDDAGFTVDLTELKDGLDEILEGYGIKIEEYEGNDGETKTALNFDKTAIDGSEANNIRKIYNWLKDTNAPMSEKEFRTRFKQAMKDMVDFNPVGRDQTGRKKADTPGDKVIKGIMKKANDLAHAQIPELAELDKIYSEWIDIMDEVSDGLVYKDAAKRGVIKDNVYQIIKNLDEPSRRQMVNRLEKLMPGIKDEVNAINQMPKVIDHIYNPSKLQQGLTSEGVKTVGAIGGLPGYLLAKWGGEGIAKLIDSQKNKAWNEVLQETSEEGKAKMAEIQAKIEANQKLSQEQEARLQGLKDRLMEKMATVEKTDAEQSAWESYLADLEQDEVIDMPEEVYDQWEEITNNSLNKENVNKTAGNQAQELYNQGDKNLSPNSEQMETTKKTTKKKSTKKGNKGDVKWYADEAYSPSITMTEEEISKFEENDTKKTTKKDATEWAEKMWKKDGWMRDDNEGKWWRYADHRIKEGVKPGEGHWTKVYETNTEKQHKERVKEHAKMKIAFDKADSKNNNKDEEGVTEVSIRDVIRQDSMPKKGVSIKKQLRGVENNNVMSVDDWKKEFIFEQYSDDNLRNELKTAKKKYNEFSKKWKEEGSYYNRDQAANYLNKIDAIEGMLEDHKNSPIGKPIKGDFENMTEEEKVRAYYEAIGEEMPEEKNGTNNTDKISLKRDLIDKLMKKGNYGEKVKVIIRKNGEMAGTHTIEKFQADGKTYYDIDEGTPNWETFDTKDMKNWLINNDTVYAEIGGEKYTTPEYSKWEEERNAQIEKEREESGIAEKERKIRNNLLSKIGDKETIERFKEYFKGELAKDGSKYDMYRDILAFLEGKKTVDDFVEGEIVINDFPNSVMQEIRERLGLNAISIKNLHSMIKEYGRNL